MRSSDEPGDMREKESVKERESAFSWVTVPTARSRLFLEVTTAYNLLDSITRIVCVESDSILSSEKFETYQGIDVVSHLNHLCLIGC